MPRELLIDGVGTTSFSDDLIMKSQNMGLPAVKKNFIDIPAGHGSIDLTEALTGDVNYGNREGVFGFDLLCDPEDRAEFLETFGAYLHGKKRKIVLPDDDDHYYYGRLEIDSFVPKGYIAELVLKATCDPFKYKVNPTWVPVVIGSSGSKNVTCVNSRKSVIPTITADAAIDVTFDSSTYSLEAGEHTITNIVFVEGANDLLIEGTEGTRIDIEYQEGAI